MAFKFADILGKAGLEIPIKKNQVYAVKTKKFYLKTRIKLYNQNDSETKARPIIICKTAQNTIEFIALSTRDNALVKIKKERKKVDLKNCSLLEEGCYQIKIKKEAFIFVLKDREKFYIDEKSLKELIDEDEAKYLSLIHISEPTRPY